MVAHELRNPLAPLRTCADLLRSPRLGDQGLAKVRAILIRQIGHLTRIVDDLLEGARVNEGELHLQRRVFDLCSVIDAAVESCQESIAARRQRFERSGPGDGVSLLVDGDPVRLVQVFANLLDNASKYTHAEGRLALAVSATVDHIRVVVSDDGIGIGADVLPRVFDLFAQDPDAVAVHGGGLGIGLAVVREMVLAHGGSVSAHSAGRGLGSAFEVVLPRVGPGADI
jgi:signal transduction histidine kinase